MASFITCVGQESVHIYNILPFPRRTQTRHGQSERPAGRTMYMRVPYSVRFSLDKKHQQYGEQFDNFLTAFKEQAQRRPFGEVLHIDKTVWYYDNTLRKHTVHGRVTLADCIDMCRSLRQQQSNSTSWEGRKKRSVGSKRDPQS